MNLVNKFFKTYESQLYTKPTWIITKILWVIYFYDNMHQSLYLVDRINTPLSLCKIIPCSFFISNEMKLFISASLLILCILYILEIRMIIVLFLISLLSILIGSISDSSGVLFRLSGYSLIFIVQLVAYIAHYKNPNKYNINKLRIHFSLQIIACLYTLAFTSKLAYSGIFWFMQTNGFSAHILKSWLYAYVTSGNEQILNKGYLFYNFIQSYPLITAFALALAMILEGFAFLTIFNSKTAFFWGIGLLGMHIGIYLTMDIKILSVSIPMVLFMLNLPAVITTIFTLVKNRNIAY